jgi:hypothetical protein
MFWNVRFMDDSSYDILPGNYRLDKMRFGLAPHSGTFLLDAGAAKQRAGKSSANAECAYRVAYAP